MKKFAVVISGCGYKDGAEITETVSALIALSEAKIQYQIFSPQLTVPTVNHLTGKTEGEHSTLIESARIARGDVQDLKSLNPKDFDAIIFPGGYGAAQHLDSAKDIIKSFHAQDKPIGAFCIAPALIASVLGTQGVTLTIGDDDDTAREIERTGATHVKCAVDDYISDRETKVITTPAYMYGEATPFQVFTGIRKAVREIIEMS